MIPELNDPVDQEERLPPRWRLSVRGSDEEAMAHYDFIRALEYGMPPKVVIMASTA